MRPAGTQISPSCSPHVSRWVDVRPRKARRWLTPLQRRRRPRSHRLLPPPLRPFPLPLLRTVYQLASVLALWLHFERCNYFVSGCVPTRAVVCGIHCPVDRTTKAPQALVVPPLSSVPLYRCRLDAQWLRLWVVAPNKAHTRPRKWSHLAKMFCRLVCPPAERHGCLIAAPLGYFPYRTHLQPLRRKTPM